MALGEPDRRCPPSEAASRAASAVRELADEIGIPKDLSGHGLRHEHVNNVVEEAMKSGNVAVNPRETSREELAEILRRTI